MSVQSGNPHVAISALAAEAVGEEVGGPRLGPGGHDPERPCLRVVAEAEAEAEADRGPRL